jgi:hypothetical protein
MKARVHSEFKTLRPGEKKNSVVEVGEIVEGALAMTAVANGFAKQVSEDAPAGKPQAATAPAKGGKSGKKVKPEDGGGSGEGGEDGGE